MKQEQVVQAEQYEFPYHYLPVYGQANSRFSRYWGWAPSYLATMRIIHRWIDTIATNKPGWRHCDIGCGDGALIYHLSRVARNRDIDWLGVDYDERAIEWAKMLNGGNTEFVAGDICDQAEDQFDSASLVEVAEHVPPDDLKRFVQGIAATLKPGGRLLVTVPHANRPVQKKHFQHFNFDKALATFQPEFEVESIKGFERLTKIEKWVRRLLVNRTYTVNHPIAVNAVLSPLQRTYDDEVGVGRIIMHLRKPK